MMKAETNKWIRYVAHLKWRLYPKAGRVIFSIDLRN